MSALAIFVLGIFVMVPVTAAFSLLVWGFVQDARTTQKVESRSPSKSRGIRAVR